MLVPPEPVARQDRLLPAAPLSRASPADRPLLRGHALGPLRAPLGAGGLAARRGRPRPPADRAAPIAPEWLPGGPAPSRSSRPSPPWAPCACLAVAYRPVPAPRPRGPRRADRRGRARRRHALPARLLVGPAQRRHRRGRGARAPVPARGRGRGLHRSVARRARPALLARVVVDSAATSGASPPRRPRSCSCCSRRAPRSPRVPGLPQIRPTATCRPPSLTLDGLARAAPARSHDPGRELHDRDPVAENKRRAARTASASCGETR